MNLLLDTHVVLWSQTAPDNLGAAASKTLLAMQNKIFVSSVSALEFARHHALGRLQFSNDVRTWFLEVVRHLQASVVPVDVDIAVEAYRLPDFDHKDPADRLLVATARLHDCQLVTADEKILHYRHVKTVDARR